MRFSRHLRRPGVHAFLGLALLADPVAAQDRGTLVVTTTPDSAVVLLDDSRDAERQRTPFSNENMIPGTHSVRLRPANRALKPAVYQVSIEAGQTSTIDHVFEYRTKAFGMEHLSIAPWKLEVSTGIEALRYIGFQSAKSGQDASGISLSKTYPSDSIPNSIHVPTELRLGFPGGWEAHFRFPVGLYAIPGGNAARLGPSDPGMGLKWVYAPLNSGLDLSWSFGNTRGDNMSVGADAFTVTALTNQKWSILDVAANLGASFRMSKLSNTNIDRGDQVFGKARAGILLADRFLPYAQASLQYTLGDDSSGTTGDPSFTGTLTPGFVWYLGKDVSLEGGIPLTLLASNAQTSWGGHLSLAWDFSLGSKTSAATARKGSALSAYPLQAPGVPGTAPMHVMFDSKEVSNAEYKEFCDKTGREYPSDPEFTGMPGYFTDPKTASYPVVKISIDDARAYAAWVGKRLPTVTEWRKEIESASVTTSMLACGMEAPEPVGTRHQGSGLYHFVGNVAEWVENDRKVGSVAYIAGGFFSLPRERCLDKSRWVDVASPAGAKYIGIRLVTEVK